MVIDFSFLFWKVVSFYGMSDVEVLAMPIYRFWSASSNVDRINAEDRIAQLHVHNSSQNKESAEAMIDSLNRTRGTVLVLDQVEADPDAWDRLERLL